MNVSLKPLHDQVMVITGASSGIGLATALAAAQQGVKLVLAARSADTLEAIAAQINEAGGEAIAVVADVGRRADVERVAERAVARFGRIDSWVNNAGVGIFGRLDEVSDDDARRLFDTNFWGVVYGSQAALPHLKAGGGGALVNVGSEASDAVLPLHGHYSASKHAVKGYTDTLRIELDADEAPVSVTLVQPTAVDTPFPDHAANYLSRQPKLPSPTIAAEKVADAILDAAAKPVRDVKVGAVSVLDTLAAKLLPSLSDMLTKLQLGRQQREEPPRSPRAGTLYAPGDSGRIRGRGDDNAADTGEAKRSNLRGG